MNTVADKLMKLVQTKSDIRQALLDKGFNVPDTMPFSGYADLIRRFPCNAKDFPDIPGMIARWSAKGLTNEDMSTNPVWKDLTGNGHDLQMKNFAWGGMSGVGGYGDENYQTFYKFTLDDYVFIASPPGVKHMNFTFRVTGLQPGNKLTLAFFGTTNTVYGIWNKDGIYTVDADIVEAGKPTYFYNGYGATRGEFTIEILPLYPGALVFDGVDDYGTCNNFPILTKEKGYTVVALRQWITRGEIAQGLVSNVKNWLKDGAFLLEYRNIQSDHLNKPISFGAIGSENDLPHILTYQTSKSYNGVSITTGNFEGTDVLHVGKLAPTNVETCINAAIWELVFLDHDATEEELTKIKDYFVKTYPWLFPDQAWTVTGKTNEDEDRATIANITGNGNNLVLNNFGFAENSGYGLYAYNFNSFTLRDNVVKPTDVKNDSFRIVGTGNSSNVLVLLNTSNSANWKIRVTGMKEGDNLIVGNANKRGDYFTITKDGIYTFQKQYEASSTNGVWYNSAQETDVLVEQIPEYEGYLVTDGVDDKITSSAFKMGKDWTVVGDWKFINDESKNAGIIKPFSLYVYNALNGVSIFINSGSIGNNIKENKGFNAICSDGRAYDRNWTEYSELKVEEVTKSNSELKIGASSNDTNYTRMAFKNFAIYPKVLSKDDCIKAYNYLQTLKS